MQAWIVKHNKLLLWSGEDGIATTCVYLFHSWAAAFAARVRMQVPDDWKVVEVEITEK
jgi:hypothetical protein